MHWCGRETINFASIMQNCDTSVPNEMAYQSYPSQCVPNFQRVWTRTYSLNNFLDFYESVLPGYPPNSTECQVSIVMLLGAIWTQIMPSMTAPALKQATSPAMPAGIANSPGANGNGPTHTARGLVQVPEVGTRGTKKSCSKQRNISVTANAQKSSHSDDQQRSVS